MAKKLTRPKNLDMENEDLNILDSIMPNSPKSPSSKESEKPEAKITTSKNNEKLISTTFRLSEEDVKLIQEATLKRSLKENKIISRSKVLRDLIRKNLVEV